MPGFELAVVRGLRSLRLLVPELALVPGPGAQVPRLDHKALCGIDVALCVDLLDANLHAVLGKDDILGLHLIVGGSGDLLHGEVEVVGEEGDAEQDDKKDDQRKELARCCVSTMSNRSRIGELFTSL